MTGPRSLTKPINKEIDQLEADFQSLSAPASCDLWDCEDLLDGIMLAFQKKSLLVLAQAAGLLKLLDLRAGRALIPASGSCLYIQAGDTGDFDGTVEFLKFRNIVHRVSSNID